MDKKKELSDQSQHWEKMFSTRKDMFGIDPSLPAIKAAKLFKKFGVKKIVELGAGQGRDTFYFAKKGFNVQVLDYSQSAIDHIIKKSKKLKLNDFISAKYHDLKKPLPFENETFDASFSHMLYCMAFTTSELQILSRNLRKVLKRDSLNIYTVRNTDDDDYRLGTHIKEDLYKTGGFIVHFFSKEKIKELSKGFKIININKFEEGNFPRKLYFVILKKIA